MSLSRPLNVRQFGAGCRPPLVLLTPEKVRWGRGGARKRWHHPLPDWHSPGAKRAVGWPRKLKKLVRIEAKDGCGESFDEEEATVVTDVNSVIP